MSISARKNLFIKNLSVFFPVYNEEGNIENTVEKALKVLEKLKLENFEVIIVNDGSIDGTGKVANNLAKKNAQVRVIHHSKNLGYGEALKSGFYSAKYDTVCYTDGDGQFDFSEVPKFLEKIADCDLVIGYRIKRQDPFFRIFFKKGWKLSLLMMFGLTLRDVDCGFKMVKKSVLEKIPHLQSQRGAMINAELAIKAKKAGFKIGQVGVSHFPRRFGKPTGANLNVIFKSYLDLLKLWWQLKDQKIILPALVAVVVLALFLRLYRIDEYMIFLGDEGRDAIAIKAMIDEGHFPAIGPPSSVGNVYLGPLYYYMMFPPMVLTKLNPVSASVMVALIGVSTVVLIYILGKAWFGRWAGFVSAFLYTISPVTINYSRFSWNPNPAPFFALISILSLYKLNKSGNFLWLILTGVAVAAAVQMHYLALILVPITTILWGYEALYRKYSKHQYKNVLSGTLLGAVSFLTVMSPLFFFDLRHDFLNYKGMVALFSKAGTIEGNLFENISRMPSLYSYNLIERYMAGENLILNVIVSFLILVPAIYLIIEMLKGRVIWPILALSIWLTVGLLGVSFYQHDVFDHYLGFLNPAPFLLFGSLVSLKFFPKKLKKFSLAAVFILIIALSFVNFSKNPLNFPPNRQLQRTQEVAKFIIKESDNKLFNFALLSENNYDDAYRFYLDLYKHKPKLLPFEKTDQLFVVCEDMQCNPIYSPKHEIAAFGWTLVEKEWEVEGIKVYKLIHNPKEQAI